jgi:hypothetical protein
MLQFLVVLGGTDPLVWRRVLVPANYSFWGLHVAIQDAMGWEDCHLHLFRVTDPASGVSMEVGIPDPDVAEDRSCAAGWSEYPIDYLAGGPTTWHYLYDFGDSWEHAVLFEGYEPGGSKSPRPECVAGAGACPPEDSGGAHHYSMTVEALRDRSHPDHDQFMQWAGRVIDPADFSLEDIWFDDPEERWEHAFGGGAF